MMDDLTVAIYCFIDDYCQISETKEDVKRKLNDAEVITVAIKNWATSQGTEGECESILSQIKQQIDDPQLNCTFSSPEEHPEYPFYLECKRHLPATQFEHQFTDQITTWQIAIDNGHNPEELWETDPFFTNGLYGDGKKGKMKDELRKHFRKQYQEALQSDNFPQDFKTLIQSIATAIGHQINTPQGRWNYFIGAYNKIKKDLYKKSLEDDGHPYFTTITGNLCAEPIVKDPTQLFQDTENLTSQQDWDNYAQQETQALLNANGESQVQTWLYQFITLCPAIENQGRTQELKDELTAHYALHGNTGNWANSDKIDFSQSSPHLDNIITLFNEIGCQDIIPTIDIRGNECQYYTATDLELDSLFGFGISTNHGIIAPNPWHNKPEPKFLDGNNVLTPEHDELILPNTTGEFNLNQDFTIQFRIAGETQWFNCWDRFATANEYACVAPLIRVGDQNDPQNSFFLGLQQTSQREHYLVLRDTLGNYHRLQQTTHGSNASHGRSICELYQNYPKVGDNPITIVRKGNQIRVVYLHGHNQDPTFTDDWKPIQITIPQNQNWIIGGERSIGTLKNEAQPQTNHFVGYLRDFRIWKKALSSEQVHINEQEIHHPNGLLGQWKLEKQSTKE